MTTVSWDGEWMGMVMTCSDLVTSEKVYILYFVEFCYTVQYFYVR